MLQGTTSWTLEREAATMSATDHGEPNSWSPSSSTTVPASWFTFVAMASFCVVISLLPPFSLLLLSPLSFLDFLSFRGCSSPGPPRPSPFPAPGKTSCEQGGPYGGGGMPLMLLLLQMLLLLALLARLLFAAICGVAVCRAARVPCIICA